MDRKNTFIIAGLVVAALVVFFVVSLQKTTISTQDQAAQTATTSDWENAPAEPVITEKTVVTAKHAYKSGSHIIAGELPLPSPCHILDTNAVVSGDKKSVVFQFVSSVKTGEVCDQAITPARFKITASADKDAKLTATLNGQEVTLNLIEAAPGEDLDNFELYIKG